MPPNRRRARHDGMFHEATAKAKSEAGACAGDDLPPQNRCRQVVRFLFATHAKATAELMSWNALLYFVSIYMCFFPIGKTWRLPGPPPEINCPPLRRRASLRRPKVGRAAAPRRTRGRALHPTPPSAKCKLTTCPVERFPSSTGSGFNLETKFPAALRRSEGEGVHCYGTCLHC